jgi:hypothetical protein
MMTLFLQYDGRRIWRFPIVMRRLKDVLDCESAAQGEGDDALILWVLLMGGVWTMAEPEKRWVRPKLRDVVHRMEIKDFESAFRRISKLPWLHTVHDELSQALWEMIDNS